MINTVSEENCICCLITFIPEFIKFYFTLGDTETRSFEHMYNIHYQNKVLWQIHNLIVV